MRARSFVSGMGLFGAVLLALADLTCAQEYPNRLIRVVASEAGGSGDVLARVVAQGLSSSLGKAVVVENRAGAVIAGETVAKTPADGYTLLLYGNTFWLLPLMRANVSYDPLRDFAPITLAVTAVNMLTVRPSVAVNSVRELIALAKARPGELNYSSAAAGSVNHLAGELFKSMAGVDIVRVPYKGPASAMNAVLAGEVQMMFPSVSSAMPHMKSGRLKGMAVTSAKSSALASDIPTMAAVGLPGYEMVASFGVFAPAGTPSAIISRLNNEIVRLVNQPQIKERFISAGMEAEGTSPENFTATMKGEIARLGKVIKDAGIRDE